MNVKLSALTVVIVAIISLLGCGGSGGSGDNPPTVSPPIPEPVGLWTQGGDSQALDTYVARLTTVGPSLEGGRTLIESSPAADASSDAGSTTTYTLEADVDEHDIVKYDGTVLAVAPSRSGCCFVRDVGVDPMPGFAEVEQSQITLYKTNPVDGSAERLSDISLAEGEAVEGLYLVGDRLQVLMSTAWWGTFGDALIYPESWQDQEITVLHYDLSQADTPSLFSKLQIEGALLTSRRIDESIIVIARHTPVIEGLVAYPQTADDVAANEAAFANVKDEDLLPSIMVNGQIVTPLRLDNCYRMNPEHPLATPLPADPAITTMLAVSVETGEITGAACSLEPVSGVYASASHLVFTYVAYGDNDTTFVHQLGTDDFRYQGSAQVQGHLYTGGMADFRISEHNDVLRLLTTSFTDDPEDRFDHRLWLLKASDEAPELELLAQLPDESAGENLGKPNEDLYGVRFIGDRAYLVTFERIDPLYVLDLSNPTQPSVAGTLEVPGFSDLLHPVNDNLLLGVGQINVSEQNFVKLELFDISDVSAPSTRGQVLLGENLDYSYSPAQYNRYAFTYRAGTDVDRFTVPYTGAVISDRGHQFASRVAMMEVRDKQTASQSALILHGEVFLEEEVGVSGETRVVLDEDAVYIANAGRLFGGLWSNPEAVAPQGN